MHVGIDEARHQRAVAEVDHLGSARPRHGRAGGCNALALDEHFAGSQEAAGVDFEQMRGVQHDGIVPAAGASAAHAVPKLIAASSAQPAAYCMFTPHLARPQPVPRSLHT